MFKDTSYALTRRLTFVKNAVQDYLTRHGNSPVMIADIGCGTGELLTIPLAASLGKDVVVYAYEPDSRTLQSLTSRIDEMNIQNIHPVQNEESLRNIAYDVMIVSEVIEHVEDPIEFLSELGRSIRPLGIMIITTPNGHGVFELETMAFNTLDLIGLVAILRKIKRSIFRQPKNLIALSNTDTLAISPHINFFTLGELYKIIAASGFSIKTIEGKHLAAGPFSDRIIDKSEKLIKLNAALGAKLPLAAVAGWMLVVEKSEDRSTKLKYADLQKRANLLRRIYSGYKRWLNVYLADKKRT